MSDPLNTRLNNLKSSITLIRRARRRLEFCRDYVLTGKYEKLLKSRSRKHKPKTFLDSPEWKSLRLKVIGHYGKQCMRCGSKEKITVDHIKPRSKFPNLALEFDNLQVLCWGCNKDKFNIDETDYRPNLRIA